MHISLYTKTWRNDLKQSTLQKCIFLCNAYLKNERPEQMDYKYRDVGKFERKIRIYSGHNIKMTRIRTGFLFYSCELCVRVSVLDGSDPSYTLVDRNFINLRNVPFSPPHLVSTAEVYLLLCICRRCYLEVILSLVDVIALVHHFVAPLPSLVFHPPFARCLQLVVVANGEDKHSREFLMQPPRIQMTCLESRRRAAVYQT